MKLKTVSILASVALAASVSNAKASALHVVVGGQVGYAAQNMTLTANKFNWYLNNGHPVFSGTVGLDLDVAPFLTLGVETGVSYINKLSSVSVAKDGKSTTYSVSNFLVPVMAKAQLNLFSHFDVFTKAGVTFVNSSASKTNDNFNVHWKNDYNFTGAIGVGYHLGAMNIFAQYTHVFGKNDITIDGKNGTGYTSRMDSLGVGVDFRI